MIVYLNPFYFVVKTENGYEFPESKIIFEPSEQRQEKLFDDLLEGKGVEEDEIKKVLGKDTFAKWKDNRLFVERYPDTKGIYSRSLSFYYRNNIGNIPTILAEKKALVLGCGGIGSHVAWNLTVLGVGNIVLVDYDKIEVSNLNRQLLYDITDLNKYKTEILKEKLQKINPLVKIHVVNERIDSEETLDKIVADYNPDVIVKGLDSPIFFSNWLDSVCKKNKKTYIAGILSGTAQMIGPTYIPDKTAPYGDFMMVDPIKDKIAGIGPSLGFVMYQMAGKISEEAFKILTDKGELRYTNRIVLYDNMRNEKVEIRPRGYEYVNPPEKDSRLYLVNFLVIMFIYFIGVILKASTLVIVGIALMYTIIVPFIICETKREMFEHSFSVFCYMIVCNLLLTFLGGNLPILTPSIGFAFISLVYTLLGLFVLLLAIFMAGLYEFKKYLLTHRRKYL